MAGTVVSAVKPRPRGPGPGRFPQPLQSRLNHFPSSAPQIPIKSSLPQLDISQILKLDLETPTLLGFPIVCQTMVSPTATAWAGSKKAVFQGLEEVALFSIRTNTLHPSQGKTNHTSEMNIGKEARLSVLATE